MVNHGLSAWHMKMMTNICFICSAMLSGMHIHIHCRTIHSCSHDKKAGDGNANNMVCEVTAPLLTQQRSHRDRWTESVTKGLQERLPDQRYYLAFMNTSLYIEAHQTAHCCFWFLLSIFRGALVKRPAVVYNT